METTRDREGEVNRSERHAVDDQEFWLGNIRELRGHFYRTHRPAAQVQFENAPHFFNAFRTLMSGVS
jgi:hypothetical protein